MSGPLPHRLKFHGFGGAPQRSTAGWVGGVVCVGLDVCGCVEVWVGGVVCVGFVVAGAGECVGDGLACGMTAGAVVAVGDGDDSTVPPAFAVVPPTWLARVGGLTSAEITTQSSRTPPTAPAAMRPVRRRLRAGYGGGGAHPDGIGVRPDWGGGAHCGGVEPGGPEGGGFDESHEGWPGCMLGCTGPASG